VILESVFRWLEDDKQAKAFSTQLETMPANTVENARRILGVQKAGPTGNGRDPHAGSVPRLQRSAVLAAGPSARIGPSETGKETCKIWAVPKETNVGEGVAHQEPENATLFKSVPVRVGHHDEDLFKSILLKAFPPGIHPPDDRTESCRVIRA